jgi:hypothetical protein
MDGRMVHGEIQDISVAGMACYLKEPFSVGTVLSDIQLRLWGTLVALSGRIYGHRKREGRTLHVVMFNSPMPAHIRGKLNLFVRKVLQWECDSSLERA